MKNKILTTLSVWCILMLSIASGQQINRAEYFFDTDPGVGNGTSITVTAGDSVDISGSINITGLSTGFHTLFIRARYNNTGTRMWSLYEGRRFYVYNPATLGSSPQITGAEYFIDNDPGIGQGTSINTGAAADSISKTASINLTGVPAGFHHLYVRVKDAAGHWSMYEPRVFYIVAPAPQSTYQISSAEYFIDNDPGIGNGTTIAMGAAADSVDINGSFSTTGMTKGFHHLAIRVKNTLGVWSLYEIRNFYVGDSVPSSGNQGSQIVHAEYFYDNDPGQGNGISVPTTFSPADSIDITSTASTSGLSLGTHYLFIRVQNADGKWSQPIYDTLNIGQVGIAENLNQSEVIIAPNPANEYTNIHFTTETQISRVELMDATGRKLIEIPLPAGQENVRVDLQKLSAGTYYWTALSKEEIKSRGKIIISH